MPHHKEELVGREINIDGEEFDTVVFKNCVLVYSGGKLPSFEYCQFYGTQFKFDGPAENTKWMLQAMFNGGLAPVVEAFIREIRQPIPAHMLKDGGATQ